jgi:hypothetical protein
MWITLLGAIDPSSIIGDEQVSPLMSLVLVYGVLLAVPLLLVAFSLLNIARYRRRATQAEAAYDPGAPLATGEATLFGTVEQAQDADVAVRVEVDQHGEEAESSGSWTHTWTEVDREVKVHPFYIRHASGERIRVDPTEKVFLVDAMDGVIRINLTQRTRVAELTAGEQVFAMGTLTRELDPEPRSSEGGAYRGAPTGYVLRRPASSPVLLSTEPLGRRFRSRAWLHCISILFILPFVVGSHLLLLPYHLRMAGSTVEGEITRLKYYTTKDDEGGTVHHHDVWIDVPDVGEVEDEVPGRIYAQLKVGDRIPVRLPVWRPASWAGVGPHATANLGGVIVSLIVLGLLVTCYVVVPRRKRWYEGRVVDSGSGKLEESLASGEESIDAE